MQKINKISIFPYELTHMLENDTQDGHHFITLKDNNGKIIIEKSFTTNGAYINREEAEELYDILHTVLHALRQ